MHLRQHIRTGAGKGIENIGNPEHKHAAIPEIIAGADKTHRLHLIRFFNKGIDPTRYSSLTAKPPPGANITIPRFRTRGRNAKRDEIILTCRDDRRPQRRGQNILTPDHMIRRQNPKNGIRPEIFFRVQRSQSNSRSRIPRGRLPQHMPTKTKVNCRIMRLKN
ncbi:MAG: hypothetical protein WBK77_02555 [Alphaproteobacteria bacterium]